MKLRKYTYRGIVEVYHPCLRANDEWLADTNIKAQPRRRNSLKCLEREIIAHKFITD